MQISVARALTELKTLNSRIENKINGTSFVAGVKKSSKKINNVYLREEFEKDVKSNYDSIVDLIERRKAIKTAIVKSNAETKVLIGGKEYTVADAIERKSSISLDKLLLKHMEVQFRNILAQVERNNDIMEQNLNNLLAQSLGSDKKDLTSMTSFADSYRNENGFEIINPLKLQEKIEMLKLEIENFEAECDSCLSESNAITKVEIPE